MLEIATGLARAAIALLSLLLLFGSRSGAEQRVESGSRPAVGFRVLERVDGLRTSRAFPKGRPIQISLWYPAASASPSLRFRDYVALEGTDTAFAGGPAHTAAEEVSRWKAFLVSARVVDRDVDALLDNPMTAARDARPAAGRYPLVLLAQGNGESVPDQAFLAELLAGNGYVVATTPSQARIGGAMKTEEEIPQQAADQAADLAFALRQVRGEPFVRPERFGLIGASFGARSALLLAMRDPGAALLVSLDGGIGARAGKGLLEKANGFDRGRATVPLLHFYEEGDRFMVPDFDLIRSLDRADRWLVRVEAMRHVHFSSLGVAVKELPSLATATGATGRTSSAWDAVAAATASFLDRFLAGRAAPREAAARWSPPASALYRVEELRAGGPAAGAPTPPVTRAPAPAAIPKKSDARFATVIVPREPR